MTAFEHAHAGDKVRLAGSIAAFLDPGEAWAKTLRLLGAPTPCGDLRCEALACNAVTPDGRRSLLHLHGWREVVVLEHGPTVALAGDL